ncbi:MAG TPA: hypothetical protein VHV55_02405 [Pirellulales bacterium]|jgi:ferritin|nr:hypothetical protein [Pirellulales bacterium]
MSETTIDLLNRLLVIEYRSLSMYLLDATPWTHPGDEKATAALRSIVHTQRSLAQRLATAIMERGGTVETGEYPMDFAELNFLSLDFLLKELLRHGKQRIAQVELIANRMLDSEGHELALEVLGAEKAHVEMLQEFAGQPAA